MGDIDRRDHPVDAKTLGYEEVFEQGVQHRRRIGEARGFDQHSRESRDLAAQAAHEQVAQATRKLATNTAAQTTGGENDEVVVDLFDQENDPPRLRQTR
jgi:hypothetical protein